MVQGRVPSFFNLALVDRQVAGHYCESNSYEQTEAAEREQKS